ncbi:MAG: L-histidine N(alpha)-methyltransferase [Planctomycetes bacterium]|jgi:dimethylhistidine N-methyltransferase|nr:L-histidine N(alpha)-methyltransferase [Planctomycetota bacterium]
MFEGLDDLATRVEKAHAREFRRDLLAGLHEPQKCIPPRYFYDKAGSLLFERICETEEYYPTRTELSIMQESAADMAAACGPGIVLIEFGSGSSQKTRLLLDSLDAAAYVPIDIAGEQLTTSAAKIAHDYPRLRVLPLCADFTKAVQLPDGVPPARRVAYFPGSTIGNFTPDLAAAFLEGTAHLCGDGAGLLIGIDMVKDPAVLARAYNDGAGITAAFNRNILNHANEVVGTDFDLESYTHLARYEEEQHRIEMHLVANSAQRVHIGNVEIVIAEGEAILTEFSHKYELDQFARLAARGSFQVDKVWTDPQTWFSVQYLTAQIDD